MKILLVYPKMPDTFYSMKHFSYVIGKKAAYPPLSLMTVASLLPGEWSKKLVDLNLAGLRRADLEWADFVFISAMNVQEESVREILESCQQAAVKTVAGGPLFTQDYLRFPTIDHFVLNEAEITLPLFLEDLKQGSPQPIYKTNEFADLTLSPLPSFELVNMNQYIYSIVQYSRGCPYLCDFCDVTALFGRRFRSKKSAQIIRELDAIHLQGKTRLVLFADDNLIGNKRVLKDDLLPALIEWRKWKKPGFFFATQLTIDLADDEELMALLTDAGFRHVFIGIETPDDEGLKESRKRQNLKRDQLDNIRHLHRAGFIVSAGFIVGFDTDTESVFQQQIDFIQQSGIPLPIVNILKAPPGTELFKRLQKEGRLTRPFAFAEGETNIAPVMGEETLFNGFIEVITNIYRPEKSYRRLTRFFSTYRPPSTLIKVPEKYGIEDITMVLRILYLLGVKDPNRIFFWKLIWWSFRNNRKNMDKSVFYGIMVYQMHRTYLHLLQTVKKQVNGSDVRTMR